MTIKRKRILAIVDPTRNDQWALMKAVSVAENRDDTDVCAFLGVYSEVDCADPDELKTVVVSRHKVWLESIIAGFASTGVAIDAQVVWDADWVQVACTAAAANDINLVVKRASGRPKSLASSDRRLIRKLQKELLLVKNNPKATMEKILVAVDFNAKDESHVALNEAVMALGRRVRGSSNEIELHSVCAYPDSDNFVHPPDVAKLLDIERAQAHVHQGNAADVIPDTANKIDANLVVLGNMGRAGLKGITIGNTSEKILADIEADVLVLVRPDEAQRDAA
jgi:universal stress protein E